MALAAHARRLLAAALVACVAAALSSGAAAADTGASHPLLRLATGAVGQTVAQVASAPVTVVSTATEIPAAAATGAAVQDAGARATAAAGAAADTVQRAATPVVAEAGHVQRLLPAAAGVLHPVALVKTVAERAGATTENALPGRPAPRAPSAAAVRGDGAGSAPVPGAAPGGPSRAGAALPAAVASPFAGTLRLRTAAAPGGRDAQAPVSALSSAPTQLPLFATASAGRAEAQPAPAPAGGGDGAPVERRHGGLSLPSLSATGAGVAVALVLACLAFVLMPALTRRLWPLAETAPEARLLLLLERPG